jgi:sortase (surface protein transpeptidase)
VVVAAFGERYIYEVRESGLHRPDDEAIFRHEEKAWLTLVTCEDYDDQKDTYRWRRVVRAVLIDILPAQ